eukprot:11150505-Alexandrium_andersonii.AAC.1
MSSAGPGPVCARPRLRRRRGTERLLSGARVLPRGARRIARARAGPSGSPPARLDDGALRWRSPG